MFDVELILMLPVAFVTSISDFTLLIYNRWGELIFESHDASVGWDGNYGSTACIPGTYSWKIEVKTSENDERKMFVGHVNLLK